MDVCYNRHQSYKPSFDEDGNEEINEIKCRSCKQAIIITAWANDRCPNCNAKRD